jgi:hypothetical protein
VADIEKGSFFLFLEDGRVRERRSRTPLDIRAEQPKAVAQREGVYRKNAVFGLI